MLSVMSLFLSLFACDLGLVSMHLTPPGEARKNGICFLFVAGLGNIEFVSLTMGDCTMDAPLEFKAR